MNEPTLQNYNGLRGVWLQLTRWADFEQRAQYELDEYGHVLMSLPPSARRQIVRTDVFCQITGQIGHLAVISPAVTTRSFGIRVPDVVWMPSERWETFEHNDPVPFVPNLCVEVLLDSNRQLCLARRIKAYLESGAGEVIVVSPSGQIEFWDASGLQQVSMFGITLSLDRIYFDPDNKASSRNTRCCANRSE